MAALLRTWPIATLLVASALAIADGIPVTVGEEASALSPSEISHLGLCSSSSAENERSPLQNPKGKQLKDLLEIAPVAMTVHYKSGDWQSAGEIARRAMEILNARPRNLWSRIAWSEAANFTQRSFVASIITAGGSKVRLEVSGYQVCAHDPEGRAWFFRAVAVDLWP
jgi:hypothetical protein